MADGRRRGAVEVMDPERPSAPPGSVRGRQALIVAVGAIVLATLAGLVLLWPQQIAGGEDVPSRGDRVRGTLTAVAPTPCNDVAPESAGDESVATPGATRETLPAIAGAVGRRT